MELSKFREAESTLLLLLEQDVLDKCQIKDLLGHVQSKVNRNELSMINLHSCISESPLLWTSFEKLCELGYFSQKDSMSVDVMMDPNKMNEVLKHYSTQFFHNPVLSVNEGSKKKSLSSSSSSTTLGLEKKKNSKSTTMMPTSSLSNHTTTVKENANTNSKKRTRLTTTESLDSEMCVYTQNLSHLAKGYQLLSNFKCQNALQVFLNLDEPLYQTSWVQNQIARAYYELNEYEKVF